MRTTAKTAGSTTTSPWRWAAVTLGLLAPLLLTIGPSTAVEPPEDFPPVITSVDVTPRSLAATGGQVTISVQAHDDDGGISQVYADVVGGESVYLSTNMPLVGTSFTGTVDVPPNWTEYDTSYQVTVYAWDLTGNLTEAYAGEVQVPGTPPFDEAPSVWDPGVSPTELPSTGGPVALSVFAWDLRGVAEVQAVVRAPDGTVSVLALQPIDWVGQFHGTFTAPSNTTAQAQTYTVQMSAYDDIGQWSTVDGDTFTVAARPAVVAGTLSLSPARRSLGKVAVGTVERKTIELRRSTAKSTVFMTGFVTSSNPAFVLVGAEPRGVPFSLLPGQRKTITVEFRPTAPGAQQASLAVLRSDGAQPTLSARLSGQGITPRR